MNKKEKTKQKLKENVKGDTDFDWQLKYVPPRHGENVCVTVVQVAFAQQVR